MYCYNYVPSSIVISIIAAALLCTCCIKKSAATISKVEFCTIMSIPVKDANGIISWVSTSTLGMPDLSTFVFYYPVLLVELEKTVRRYFIGLKYQWSVVLTTSICIGLKYQWNVVLRTFCIIIKCICVAIIFIVVTSKMSR